VATKVGGLIFESPVSLVSHPQHGHDAQQQNEHDGQ